MSCNHSREPRTPTSAIPCQGGPSKEALQRPREAPAVATSGCDTFCDKDLLPLAFPAQWPGCSGFRVLSPGRRVEEHPLPPRLSQGFTAKSLSQDSITAAPPPTQTAERIYRNSSWGHAVSASYRYISDLKSARQASCTFSYRRSTASNQLHNKWYLTFKAELNQASQTRMWYLAKHTTASD